MDTIEKLGIDITGGCQLKCVGCPNSLLDRRIEFMSVENFKTILSNIDAPRINLLRLFNFGEPLLHKDLPAILNCIDNCWQRILCVEISTNAQHLDVEMLKTMAKQYVIDRIVVSCDGDGTPESYEALRPPAKWDKLMEFCEALACIKAEYDNALQLVSRTICTDAEGQKRWGDILGEWGITPQFRAWYDLPNSVRSSKVFNYNVCSFLTRMDYVYVDYDGAVVPCCCHPRAFVIGNLLHDRFMDILEVKKKMVTHGRSPFEICTRCGYPG